MTEGRTAVRVRRTYDSRIQRETIWRALVREFRRRKRERPSFGRGRYLNLIYTTLSHHSGQLFYDDGEPFLVNYEAVTDSDLRDALDRDLQPGERWGTDDHKVRHYHAFLQLVLPGGFVAGDTASRYDDAANVLWQQLGYSAGAWQAKGAEMVSGDLSAVWVGSIDLATIGVDLGEDYECRFRLVDGEPFDGTDAHLQAFTRFTKFKTAYMPNAVLCFGDPLPGGFRPVALCLFPLRGVLRSEAAAHPFRDYAFQHQLRERTNIQTDLRFGLYTFFEKTEPLVFGGMAVPTFKNLRNRFTKYSFGFDPKAYLHGERRRIVGEEVSGSDLLLSLDMIDQSVETSLLFELFGANNDLRIQARMQFCGHPLPLVNNIFFALTGSLSTARITSSDLNEERTGRQFPPPLVWVYDMSKIYEIYDLLEHQADLYGLQLPRNDPRPTRRPYRRTPG